MPPANLFDFAAPRGTARRSSSPSRPRSDDNLNLYLGLAGALVLLLGLFCPAIKIPIIGGISYFGILVKQIGNGNLNDLGVSALLILSSCVGAFVVAPTRCFAWLWASVVGVLLGLGITLVSLFAFKAELRAEVLDDNPFAGLARAAAAAVGPDFGLGVLVIGVGLLIAAATIRKKR